MKTIGFQFVYKELWSKLADMWAAQLETLGSSFECSENGN